MTANVSKTTIAQAIRSASKSVKQGRMMLFRFRDKQTGEFIGGEDGRDHRVQVAKFIDEHGVDRVEVGEACAMGLVALGMGEDPLSGTFLGNTRYWPKTFPLKSTTCPEGGLNCTQTEPRNPDAQIMHLNDDHNWSAERIAAWIKKEF